ncbi:hypothetical protein M440DRAFT_287524 [Trichoderma longibrachiatum ATCC 18648]|uniref:Uncharacterized protein n=1 Tax=Trichoderma longibrachiatum ATCC 18648 TaxID=983965 RepID=A0A2T4C7Z4_TRILO|nr:hypothetical protein M440DRAFT_287524 [Trichoderma longibrachiatum ATCC 18648]
MMGRQPLHMSPRNPRRCCRHWGTAAETRHWTPLNLNGDAEHSVRRLASQTRSVRSGSRTRLFVLGQAALPGGAANLDAHQSAQKGGVGQSKRSIGAYGPSGKMWTAAVRDGRLDLDLDFLLAQDIVRPSTRLQ